MIEKSDKVQNDIASESKSDAKSTWMSKAVSFIVCDISLERFCTAGILSECCHRRKGNAKSLNDQIRKSNLSRENISFVIER
jgi:hypothetical protein